MKRCLDYNSGSLNSFSDCFRDDPEGIVFSTNELILHLFRFFKIENYNTISLLSRRFYVFSEEMQKTIQDRITLLSNEIINCIKKHQVHIRDSIQNMFFNAHHTSGQKFTINAAYFNDLNIEIPCKLVSIRKMYGEEVVGWELPDKNIFIIYEHVKTVQKSYYLVTRSESVRLIDNSELRPELRLASIKAINAINESRK